MELLDIVFWCSVFNSFFNRETIARVTGGMKVKADRDEVCSQFKVFYNCDVTVI